MAKAGDIVRYVPTGQDTTMQYGTGDGIAGIPAIITKMYGNPTGPVDLEVFVRAGADVEKTPVPFGGPSNPGTWFIP